MKELFLAEIGKCIEKAQETFGVDLTNTTVLMDLKGLTAAWAERQGDELTLKFNEEAIEKYYDDMVKETIPHEVAHLVCFQMPHLGKGHDAGWKTVCSMLGGKYHRCHDMELTPARKKRTFEYISEDGDLLVLSIVRHNKLQNNKVMAYTCNSIRYTKDEFIRELSC